MHILIIEDDPGLSELIKTILTSEEHEIELAHSAKDAITWLNKHNIDLLLLDYGLPDMNGKELILDLKQKGTTLPPFVVLTGQGDERIAVEMMKLGARDYLVKDIHFLDLVQGIVTRVFNEIQNEESRKKAEIELEKNREQLQLIFDNSPVIMMLLNEQTEILRMNKTGLNFSGTDSETVFKDRPGNAFNCINSLKNPKGCGYSDDCQHCTVRNTVLDTINNNSKNQQVEAEFTILKEGNKIKYNLLVSSISASKHPEATYLVTLEDITERKKTQLALKESEQKFRTVVTSSDAITWMLDENGYFTLSEGKGLSVLGLSPGETVGINAFDLYKNYPEIISGLKDAYRGKTVYKLVQLEDLYFQTIYTPYMAPGSNSVKGIVGISLDITEKHKAEEDVKKKQEELNEINQLVSEYKLAALRSAMNPHFVFNCLNSIQMYVAKNERKPALNYLSLFSKLIRSVLESSINSQISLEKELEVLNYYIELEKMRFSDKFNVIVDVGDEIDTEGILVPSLFLQPFVENAIIHGLSNKSSQGLLSIIMRQEENFLNCTIEDDGIGRIASYEFNKKRRGNHKSVGVSVTEERLNIINKTNNVSVQIKDLYDAQNHPCGTSVKIKLEII